MGNLASGHFKPTNNIQEQHNDRTLSPSYLIPQEFRGQNEVNRPSTQARGLRDKIIENAKETYLITFKQKSQSKSYQWSLVVNIKTNTTMSDLEKLAEHFEMKYGFQCYQIAIHRDEGYMDENNQPHINHHAHMEFITLNKENGKNMMRKAYLSPKKFADMQTEIAQILGMERGTDKRISGTERIEPRKYAQMKNKERKKLEAKDKELNTLKQEKTNLKDKLQEKDKTINELQERPTTEQYSQLEQANSEQAQTIQAKDKEIATLNTINAKLEKTNQDLQRPSMWDTIKEKWIDATKNAKKVEELKQQNSSLLEENQKIGNEDLKNTIEIILLKDNNNDLLKQNEKLKQENENLKQNNADLKNEIATALDTANEHFQSKAENLQKAVERNNEQSEKYLAMRESHENRNPNFVEEMTKKHQNDSVFTNLFNAIKERFSLKKLIASIKKILFGDENAEKDPQEIEQKIKELSERPTKTELIDQRYYHYEAVKHYQEAEKIVFNGKTNSWTLVTDDDAKKLNERLTELVGKESKLNTLESTDLAAIELEKSQKRVKTLESNETTLKNDLNAKENTIQAKDKEINTLKNKIQDKDKTINELNQFKNSSNLALELEKAQERIETLESNEIALIGVLHDKENIIQSKGRTINRLKKELKELEDNYRLERERMVAENKRLKEQGLEKNYTQKDYEDLKKAHHQEVEELKKQIQEYKTKETYTPTKRM